LFTAILSASSLLALASDPAPQMTEISQKAAKPGEVVTVSGQGLSPKNVDEIYLTDHKFDMRVKVLDQKDTAVQFRVPPFAKPGRMQLLFLTKGNDVKGNEPKLLEQPVYLLIEDPETEIAVAKPAPQPAKTEPAKTDEAKPEPKEQIKVDPVTIDQSKSLLGKPEQTKQDLTKQDPRQPKL
jgi:hypothetical protein